MKEIERITAILEKFAATIDGIDAVEHEENDETNAFGIFMKSGKAYFVDIKEMDNDH